LKLLQENFAQAKPNTGLPGRNWRLQRLNKNLSRFVTGPCLARLQKEVNQRGTGCVDNSSNRSAAQEIGQMVFTR